MCGDVIHNPRHLVLKHVVHCIDHKKVFGKFERVCFGYFAWLGCFN